MLLKLAIKSLLSRKGSFALTLTAMTVSICVLFAVNHIRQQAKESFASTVSGVDLIVGARTGSLNLLLYSVFRIGAPTNNISWQTYEKVRKQPDVKWAIPMSLGDSHRGYRVLGTSVDYFDYFSYGDKRKLKFAQGKAFNKVFDLVLGSEIAKKLGYELDQEVVISHGLADTSFSRHDKFPFKVVGILEPTGTPVDQTLHVSLEGIEAVHLSWPRNAKPSIEAVESLQLQPKNITAFMLGLESRMMTFKVQRSINEYQQEPLLAILPGVALSELWQMMSILERTLLLVSVFVFIAALLGLSAMLLSSISSRSQEIKLLRAVGAHPSFLFLLIELEALLICVLSILTSVCILSAALSLGGGLITSGFGLQISQNIFSSSLLYFTLAIILASIVIAAIPSIKAYSDAKHSSN